MKHILFDTDDVVVHSDMWSQEYSRRTGITTDIMIPFFRGVFQDCLVGKSDLKESLSPFLGEWGWTKSTQEYLDAWFAYENNIDKKLIEKIRQYRGYGIQCHVATNQEKYRLAYLRNEMGFSREFDSVFCSSEIGHKKPASEFYTHILDVLEIKDTNDIVYYDDAEENIEAAKKLGINAILYKTIDDLVISN
ncbi:HAD-IA family hydrolase [Candidatus Gracilibacteria bacterium]|nr:HAD-IA family hydrolase [Candidatus Gracilibacteria bacterium]